MTGGKGDAPKALIYLRVSTAQQAEKGFSLAEQRERLRAHAAAAGWEIAGEFVDGGESGGTLARPALDRLRARAAEGGVALALAASRDRWARDPLLLGLLRAELEEAGCRLKALNDHGDAETPEGALTLGLLDELAKFERAKTRERTMRGKLQRAREGRIVFGGQRSQYGFRPDAERLGYEVHEPEMGVVRRVFREVAGGGSLHGLCRALDRDGVPTPNGRGRWATKTLRSIVLDSAYEAHTAEELDRLAEGGQMSAAVRARAPEGCGVWYYNRRRTRRTKVPREGGGYRTKTRVEERPPSDWIAVPVPTSGVPRDHAEAARAALAHNSKPVSNSWGRTWELSGGLFRCTCGRKMSQVGTQTGRKKFPYHYYACSARRTRKDACPNNTANVRAEPAEADVWRLVRALMLDPERLRNALDAYVETQKAKLGNNPEAEERGWARQIAAANRTRAKYQEMFANDAATLEELGAKLAELDDRRREAEAALREIGGRAERLAELERDREAALRSYAEATPEMLDALDGEGRNALYHALGLRFTARPGHAIEVTGPLLTAPTGDPSGGASETPGCEAPSRAEPEAGGEYERFGRSALTPLCPRNEAGGRPP
jgi:site-specific DNA recombinase